MNDKKLYILGIDNNPKVWYNEGGELRVPPLFGILARKIFVHFAY